MSDANSRLLQAGCAFVANAASCSKRSKFGSSSRRWNGTGMPSFAKGERVGFVAADQQAWSVRFVVDQMIRVAHRRHRPQFGRRLSAIGPVSRY